MELKTGKSTSPKSQVQGVSPYIPETAKAGKNTAGTESASFSDILNYALGGSPKPKTNQELIEEYSRKDYDYTSFDKDTVDLFNQFMGSGINLNKLHVIKNYLSELKDAEEFEKAMKDIIREAKNQNKAAQEALTIITMIKQQAERDNKSPEETFAMIRLVISHYQKTVHPKTHDKSTLAATDLLLMAVKSGLNSEEKRADKITASQLLSDFYTNLDKSKRFEDSEAQQLFVEVMNFKVKKTKKYDNSTKKYLNSRKELEELDLKIKEIMKAAGKIKETNNPEEIILQPSTVITTPHATDINRLNSYLETPAFAL